jgi:uncharacterized damage-inducible protein DinB
MSERAAALAGQFERANDEFIATIAGLSDAQWGRSCPDDGRSVAEVAHHIVDGYTIETRAFAAIVAGQPLPPLVREEHDRANAERAARAAGCTRDEVVALARREAAAAAAFVRSLTDDQLAREGAYVGWAPPMSIAQLVERVLVGHVRGHLAGIRAAAGA